MTPRKIALFDMDQTLTDYDTTLLNDLERLRCSNEDRVTNLYGKLPSYIEERIRLIKRQPGWWENLPELKLGIKLLTKAIDIGFDVHILTQGPYSNSAAWAEKIEWCKTLLPHVVKITITRDKSLMYGRVLVDDFPEYMDAWLKWRPRGLGIMPVSSNNKDYEHPNVVMFDDSNFNFAIEKLQQAFERGE
jgi:hypothetical protein